MSVFKLVCLSLLSSISVTSHPLNSPTINSSLSVPLEVEYISKRFYRIQRLEKPIGVLLTLKKHKHHCQEHLFAQLNPNDKEKFSTQEVRDVFDEIIAQHDFKAFEKLWRHYQSFHHIDNNVFSNEFVKLVLILIKSHSGFSTRSLIELDMYVDLIEWQLNYIDYLVSMYDNTTFETNRVYESSSQGQPPFDIFYEEEPASTYTQAIAQRFYTSRRLAPTVNQVLMLQKKHNCSPFFNYEEILNTYPNFNNTRIMSHIKQIKKENTPRSLETLWEEFCHFKYLATPDYNRQFVVLLFLAERNFFLHVEHIYGKKSSHEIEEQINQAYRNLESMSVDEILDALDLLAEELPKIVEKYELNTNMTWKQWFSKYWWAPPIIAGTLAFRLYYKLK